MKEEDLWRAAGLGKVSEVEKLLQDPTINVNWQDPANNNTPFFRSCFLNNVPVLKLLLKTPGVDVSRRQKELATPFFIACQEGHLEVVNLLLADDRIDVNVPMMNNAMPICIAAQNGFTEIVRAILASDRDVDITQNTKPGDDPWSDKSTVGITRWAAQADRFHWESVEGQVRRWENCGAIADLLEHYLIDKAGVRSRLRKLPGLRDPFIAKMFALVVFFSDDMLRLPHSQPHDPPDPARAWAIRYLSIAVRLPLELQMVLCNRTFGSTRDLISSKTSEPAFVALATTLTQPPPSLLSRTPFRDQLPSSSSSEWSDKRT